MKPLCADAMAYPVLPVVRSVTAVSRASPPDVLASKMWTEMRSPGFMKNVSLLGVNVELSASCGLGGPGGTPFVCRKAKLTGSVQLLLHWKDWVHSTLSM